MSDGTPACQIWQQRSLSGRGPTTGWKDPVGLGVGSDVAVEVGSKIFYLLPNFVTPRQGPYECLFTPIGGRIAFLLARLTASLGARFTIFLDGVTHGKLRRFPRVPSGTGGQELDHADLRFRIR